MQYVSRRKHHRGQRVEVQFKDGTSATGFITEWGSQRMTIVTPAGVRISTSPVHLTRVLDSPVKGN
jgi:hypothetical protein